MPAPFPAASLTVHTDPETGMRIALAVRRAGPASTPVPWKRLPYAGLDEAISLALREAGRRSAFAVVLPGSDSAADPLRVLAECLAWTGVPGLVPAPETVMAMPTRAAA
ncbi:MAG TPA: hypothetical protein VED40_17435 [Azospirillaceae bacterium]|nr:hypothetical protein [Azospirillaceae bacterium]